MRATLLVATALAILPGCAVAQGFTPPVIEGFNPASPSIVAPRGDNTPSAVKPKPQQPSKQKARSQARRSQPAPADLYQNKVPINPLPGNITAPMPNPRDMVVPPPVPPASPLASPPPGQSCDPYGPGHCGLKWR